MSEPKIVVTPAVELSEQDAKAINDHFKAVAEIMHRVGVKDVHQPPNYGIKASVSRLD